MEVDNGLLDDYSPLQAECTAIADPNDPLA